MRVVRKNIEVEDGGLVAGRDLVKDGNMLDNATYLNIPNTIIKRDNTGFAEAIVSRALILNTARRIALTGDVTGSATFDGSQSININTTILKHEHNHDDIYYKKNYIDTLEQKLQTEINNKITIDDIYLHIKKLSSGAGISKFTYDGSKAAVVAVSFGELSTDSGSSNNVARADHNHNSIYFTKNELNTGVASSLKINGKFIELISKGNDVLSSIQVPWALKLGSSVSSEGLSLNSTELNNEANKVVRTSSNGTVNFGKISTITDLIDDYTYIYVGTADNIIKRISRENFDLKFWDRVHKSIKLYKEDFTEYVYVDTRSSLQKILSSQGDNVYVNTADKLATARTIELSGNATGSASFDGSKNINIVITVNNSQTSDKLTTTRTISLSGNATGSASFDGSTDADIAVTVNNSQTSDKLTTARTISLTNEVTGSASFDGSGDISISATVTRTTYISSAAPSNSVGKDGDIWFQWI